MLHFLFLGKPLELPPALFRTTDHSGLEAFCLPALSAWCRIWTGEPDKRLPGGQQHKRRRRKKARSISQGPLPGRGYREAAAVSSLRPGQGFWRQNLPPNSGLASTGWQTWEEAHFAVLCCRAAKTTPCKGAQDPDVGKDPHGVDGAPGGIRKVLFRCGSRIRIGPNPQVQNPRKKRRPTESPLVPLDHFGTQWGG